LGVLKQPVINAFARIKRILLILGVLAAPVSAQAAPPFRAAPLPEAFRSTLPAGAADSPSPPSTAVIDSTQGHGSYWLVGFIIGTVVVAVPLAVAMGSSCESGCSALADIGAGALIGALTGGVIGGLIGSSIHKDPAP